MNEFPLRSRNRSPFHRLHGCSIRDVKRSGSSCRCCSADSTTPCKQITSETILQSLALSGLEQAVKATHASTASIHAAGVAWGEVKASNIAASEARVHEVDELVELVEYYPFSFDGLASKGRESESRGSTTAHRIIPQ